MRFFHELPDPRAANVRHRLSDLILIALMAIICDADGWEQIGDFARTKANWLRTFMDFAHGPPSADTFRRVLSRLDPEAFEACFMQWMTAVVEQSEGRLVAVDGKSLRRSFDQGWDKSGMAHMVSAFAAHNGQTLAQIKTDGKGGELAGIKQLLGLVDLRGATVTIDAIGCQKSIAKQVIDGGGDYLLAVKDNQKALHHAVKTELDDMIRNQFKGTWHDYHSRTDGGHGRIETRRVWATDQLDWLKPAGQWKGLTSVVVVESEREVIGQAPTTERRYYITSHQPDAEQLANAIRNHWAIENSLHHVLDVTFHEDHSRIRKDHGPQNISRLRRIALGLLKTAKDAGKTKSIRRGRKIAGWDHQFLLSLFT